MTDVPSSQELEPFDWLMLRAEQDPRGRTGLLSIALLDRTPDFARLRETFDRASRMVLRMRQKVVVPTLPLTNPHWVVDPDFDLEFHVRRVVLPAPGTWPELLEFAQHLMAAPFDLARPLWEMVLVEGVHEGEATAGLVMKAHHALMDGVGGIEMFQQVYDFERDVDRGPLPPLPVPNDLSPADLTRRAAVRLPAAVVVGGTQWATGAVRSAGRIARQPGAAASDVMKLLRSAQRVMGPPPAPPSPLLQRRGLGRRLFAFDFPLDELRRAAKSVGGSVNDAYLSGVSGGLRRYHEALGVPVDGLPLAFPVSTRTDDDPAGGNRFAGARIAAPVGEPDPARRIELIREAVLTAKAEPAMNALSFAMPIMSRVPTAMLSALSGLGTSTDVQASNIPGWPDAPYFAGAKVLRMYGFGPLPGVPIMIVMTTQAGICHVGVHYDTAAVQDQELFERCLREGFDEVLALGSP
jgi:WS/DGAT/MGAT family acyltransferase